MTSGPENSRRGLERLLRIAAADLSVDTAQSPGMRRLAAVSSGTTGSRALWMGLTLVEPGFTSAAHHHGRSETGIYVVSGTPTFRFRDGEDVVELVTGPGDFVFVPPYVAHIELNREKETAAVVIARSTDEAIVENLDSL